MLWKEEEEGKEVLYHERCGRNFTRPNRSGKLPANASEQTLYFHRSRRMEPELRGQAQESVYNDVRVGAG